MQSINRLAGITTLVFDGGNTLIKELPYEGAMVDWPIVLDVPGAIYALQSLKSRYRLVVASNAVNSNGAQIEAALDRVGMGGLIERFFTFSELGFRKPEHGFFDGICSTLGTNPEEMVMIGDIWKVDMLGALQSGWGAAWYNPQCMTCPGMFPSHQVEIHDMADLPHRLSDLDLPDPQVALRWLQEEGTSQTILIHVQMVAALAYQMAEWLAARGEPINPILAHRGGLLHDLAKLSAYRPNAPTDNHGDLAGLLLEPIGQPALAEIARRHLFYLPAEADLRAPRTWEEKLVYFCDKLVEGTRLARLDERVASLNQRYPDYVERFAAGMPAVRELENEICQILGVTPSGLFDLLQQALFEEKPVVIGNQN